MRVTLVVLLFGCGSSVPNEARDYYHSLDGVTCEFRARCCGDTSGQSACTTNLDNALLSTLGQIQASIDQGVLTYHSDVANACINAQKGALADCNNDATALAANVTLCAGVFTGNAPAGAACPSGGGCASGLACRLKSSCGTPAADGASCASAPCATGLACLPSIKCGAPLAAGTMCTRGDQCASNFCSALSCAAMGTVKDISCS
jgi:hypothetical protein